MRFPWYCLTTACAKARVYLRIYWLCFKWIFKLNLGDVVVYRGVRYQLIQGVCAPLWDLVLFDEDRPTSSEGREEYVHEREFKKEISLRNVWHDVTSCYRFFKGYWFQIWVNEIRYGKNWHGLEVDE